MRFGIGVADADEGQTGDGGHDAAPSGCGKKGAQRPGHLSKEVSGEALDSCEADSSWGIVGKLGRSKKPVPEAEDDPEVDRRPGVALVVMMPQMHPRAVEY
ncbi:MAG: hypothetical protein AAGD10_20455, partial [Myxococcota bacterium]